METYEHEYDDDMTAFISKNTAESLLEKYAEYKADEYCPYKGPTNNLAANFVFEDGSEGNIYSSYTGVFCFEFNRRLYKAEKEGYTPNYYALMTEFLNNYQEKNNE